MLNNIREFLLYQYLLFDVSAKNSSCNIYSEFECGNGDCVDYVLTCDGIPHCKDKSDEKLLYCGKCWTKTFQLQKDISTYFHSFRYVCLSLFHMNNCLNFLSLTYISEVPWLNFAWDKVTHIVIYTVTTVLTEEYLHHFSITLIQIKRELEVTS